MMIKGELYNWLELAERNLMQENLANFRAIWKKVHSRDLCNSEKLYIISYLCNLNY